MSWIFVVFYCFPFNLETHMQWIVSFSKAQVSPSGSFWVFKIRPSVPNGILQLCWFMKKIIKFSIFFLNKNVLYYVNEFISIFIFYNFQWYHQVIPKGLNNILYIIHVETLSGRFTNLDVSMTWATYSNKNSKNNK